MDKKIINNLEVIFLPTSHNQVSLQAWFKVGSSSDTVPGIAHFLEHLFFKGSKNYPGNTLTDRVESLGGEFNAFTSFDYTCYYIQGPSENASQLLDLLLDMISHPLFKKEDVITEREVVHEEYLRYEDNPSSFQFKHIQNTFFEEPYKEGILGNPNSILNFTHDQVVNFRNTFYSQENFFLLIGGTFDEPSLTKSIFNAKLPKGTKAPTYALNFKEGVDIHEKDRPDSNLCFFIKGDILQKTAFKDLFLNFHTLQHTGLLYKKLIQTGIAHSLDGSSFYLKNNSLYFFSIDFPTRNLKKILDLLLEELQKNPSLEEKNSILNQLKSDKIFDGENLESFAFRMGNLYALTNSFSAEQEYFNSFDFIQGDYKNFFDSFIISLQNPLKSSTPRQKTLLESFRQDLLKESKKSPYNIKKIADNCSVITFNNRQLVYHYYDQTPTFSFQIYCKNERQKSTLPALDLFTSELLTYESFVSDYSYENLWKEIQKKSLSFTSFTGKVSAGIKTHGFTKDFSFMATEALWRFLAPSFKQEYIDKNKTLFKAQAESFNADPVKTLFHLSQQHFFKNTPLADHPFGNTSEYSKITTKALSKYHSSRNSSFVLGFSGNLSIEEVLSVLDSMPLKRKDVSQTTLKKFIPSTEVTIQCAHLERSQSHIFIATAAPNLGDKDFIPLRIMQNYLQGQSSELFRKIRDEQSLCYTVSPIYNHALNGSTFGIYIGTHVLKEEQAILALREFLQNLMKGIDESLFEKAKKRIHYDYLMSKQAPEDFIDDKLVYVLYDLDPNYHFNIQKDISQFSYKSFQTWCKHFFNQEFSTFLVGPKIERKFLSDKV